jgi:hypothetical protein
MSIVGDVFGVGGLSTLAKDLIDKFVPDPAAKAAALAAIDQNKVQMQQMENDLEEKLNETAGENIRADAASGDKFTQRARPTFMYIVESILAFNFIGVPIAQMFGAKIAPLVLPGDLLTLFGVCVTGYVMSRGLEKVAAMPGDSQVSLAGGLVKIGQKS